LIQLIATSTLTLYFLTLCRPEFTIAMLEVIPVEKRIMFRSWRSAAAIILTSLVIAFGLGLPPAMADDTSAPPAAPAPGGSSPEDRQLRNDVDAYFHYAWLGRYDLAGQFGQKVVDEAGDPAALIPVLESIANLHDQTMGYMAQLLLFDNQPDIKDVTDKLLLKVQAGHLTRAQDPALIAQTIRDMSLNERAYENHLPELRDSGELAVPVMIQFLQNPDDDHKPYRGTVRRAMVDLGKSGLNPLLAATEMQDNSTLLTIIDTLGALGYDVAAPYLERLANDNSRPEDVRTAAGSAIGRLQLRPGTPGDAAVLYYQLAIRFYYRDTQIGQVINHPGPTPATPVQMCNYWNWDADKGLIYTEVPAEIFNDLMAMRTTETALSIRADMPESVALWLDANNQREVDLPQGDTDPIRGGQPSAHYFNVCSGARHLDDALARALKDRNSPVAFKLSRSLGLIVGTSSMNLNLGGPLTDALRYPEKRVRYEAACALAGSLPSRAFPNAELVVPLLVQAIGEGGQGNVLVLANSQDDANALGATLQKAGYLTAGGGSPGDAIAAAQGLPSVDAIVFARGTSDEAIGQMLSIASRTPALEGSVQVVMKDSDTGPIAGLALSNSLLSITTETDGQKLKDAIDAVRSKAGLAPLDPAQADAYALRAAGDLENLALSQSTVLPASVGQPGLLGALNGPKGDLVSLVGKVLSHLPSAEAQQGLAQHALDDQTPQAVRLSLFQSLTLSAKAFGNQLDPSQVSLLNQEAIQLQDPDLRAAAAEARGALNLPTDQATALILSHGTSAQ
jgi:hypothetical protein